MSNIESFPNNEIQKNPGTDQEKLVEYRELLGGEPEAIYIQSRTLVEKGADKKKKIGGYGDVDMHGAMSGGHARNTAAAELFKYFPSATLITASWIKQHGPVSYARVAAEQLKKYGVPEEQIILEEYAYNTFTEVLGLLKIIIERKWQNVAVVANEYQIRRSQAFLDHIDGLHDPAGEWKKPEVQELMEEYKKIKDSVSIKFVSAEEIISGMNERYAKVVAQARALPNWKSTEDRENYGADLIERGEYWKDAPATSITKNE